MHEYEKTCPERQGYLEEKRCLRGNGSVKADVGPAMIMMVPWLISTRPGHAIRNIYKKRYAVLFVKILT